MVAGSQDNLDALDSLLKETQDDDPMHQKGAPTPKLTPEDKAELEAEPLVPFVAPVPPPEAIKPPNELDGLVSKFLCDAMKLAKRAQERSEDDRAEVQVAIDHLFKRVLTGKPNSSELETLAAVLRIKTDATSNMAKLGDMIARIVSSGKGQLSQKTMEFDLDDLADVRDALEVPDYNDAPPDPQPQPQNPKKAE